jgi:hypothetical protein
MLPQPKVLARLLGAAALACLMAACVTLGPDFATPAKRTWRSTVRAADEMLALTMVGGAIVYDARVPSAH